MWQGFNQDALALLAPENLPGPASDALAARRSALLGNVESSLHRLDQADATFQATEKMPGARSPEVIGDLLLGEGKLAALHRDAAKAERLFEQAVQIAQDNGQPFLASKGLGNLGVLQMQQYHFADAVDRFNASLAAAKASDAQASMVKLTVNLGWAYLQMGDFDRASLLFKETEENSQRLGMAADQNTAVMSMAAIQFTEHHYSAAEKGYEDALQLSRRLNNTEQTAFCLIDLAQTAIAEGNFALAEKYNQEALQVEHSLPDRTTELDALLNRAQILAWREDSVSAKQLIRAVIQDSRASLSLQGYAYWVLARIDTQLNQVQDARMHYRASIMSLEKSRKSLGRDEFELSYPSIAKDIYDDYIDFLVEHNRPEEAFGLSEMQRARTLIDGLGLTEVRSQAFDVGKAQRAAAGLGHPILSYWVGTRASYLWVVLPNHTQLFVLPSEETIRPLVERYRAHLLGLTGGDSLESADGQQLYKMLIGPAEPWIKPQSEVTIISDGPLCGLNFETLPVAAAQPHYWIEDVSITNASSAVLLAFGSRAKGPQAGALARNLLLIGNPQSPPNYPPLTHAGEEIRLVEQHFGKDQETVLSGAQATPAAYFKAQPGRYSLIHFVAHGTASRVSPLDSAVVLSQDGSSYNLYARDIAASRLHANLVTISACDSAGARIYSSEGLVGLSWAFLRAGAERVIASLWEVNDASTPKLMDQLYSSIAAGSDPAAALRSAKLTLLRSKGIYSRPFYWAPFVLYQGI